MRIEFGLTVDCSDGPGGTVGDVVIDPRRRTVTHLVVEPHHRHHLARLVPIDDLDPSSGSRPRMRCAAEELRRYPEVEDTTFVRFGEWPALDGEWEMGVSTVLSLPFDDEADLDAPQSPIARSEWMVVAVDRVPAGEVELRRGSMVEDAAGDVVGHLEGLVADEEGLISALLVERGHLWSRRSVTLPVDAVEALHTDRVGLRLTRAEVDGLPSARRHGHRASRT